MTQQFVLCRKCGLPITIDDQAVAFGSEATGWEHLPSCPVPFFIDLANTEDVRRVLIGFATGVIAHEIQTDPLFGSFLQTYELPKDADGIYTGELHVRGHDIHLLLTIVPVDDCTCGAADGVHAYDCPLATEKDL